MQPLYREVPPVPRVRTELHTDLVSIGALNPFWANISMSRGTMFTSSHLAQTLTVEGSTPKKILTGAEFEFGKGTFKLKLPCNSEVIRVIPKYSNTVGINRIEHNPMSLVIYENIETKEVGIVELIEYSTATDNKHQHFGFRYNYRPDLNEVLSKPIPAGTILADSPAIAGFSGYDNYHYGIETNVAFMSVPGIIEDGIVMSESYRQRAASKGFEKRVASWGKKYYPLNLYGDYKTYKAFPDIGETIRPDGLLFALRSFNDLLGPVELSPRALRTPDYNFDRLIYGVPNARVIDINVQHPFTNRPSPTPVGMSDQTLKYHEGQKHYYLEILNVYQELYYSRKDALNITPEFDRLVVEAIDYIGLEDNPLTRFHKKKPGEPKSKIHKLYRRNDIEDWRVEVAFEYRVVPNIGHKLTGIQGDNHVSL
jgi:hypothetical protein